MYVHSHSPLSRGSQVSRTSKSQEGGVVRRRQGGALANAPMHGRNTPDTTLLNRKPLAVRCPRGLLRFRCLGKRLSVLVSSPAQKLIYNCTGYGYLSYGLRGKDLPTGRFGLKQPRPIRGRRLRLRRGRDRTRSAGQLLKELHGSAAHRCQLALGRKL